MEHIASIKVQGGQCRCEDGVVSMRDCVVDFEVYDRNYKEIDAVEMLSELFPDFDKNKMGHSLVNCTFVSHLAPVQENE